MAKVVCGINGAGRIGLQLVKHYIDDLFAGNSKISIALINDPFCNIDNLVYRLRFDTTHGRFPHAVDVDKEKNLIKITCKDDKSKTAQFTLTMCKTPEEIPCKAHNVQIILECTGRFVEEKLSRQHLHAGSSVKHVIVSAPCSGENVFTAVYGVNHTELKKGDVKSQIISNASCTTNCLAPLIKVLHDNFTVQWGSMTTTHAATATQKVVDGVASKNFASARSVFNNITPASTGAAKAIGKVLKDLDGKINGNALRVPTLNVSVTDLTCGIAKATTVAEVQQKFQEASQKGSLQGVLGVAEPQTVSMDYNGCPLSSIFISESAMCFNEGKVVKVQSFYDNEFGYSKRLLDLTKYVANELVD